MLELKAAQLGLLTFLPRFKATSVHIQMGNIVALKYILKMGGTKSLDKQRNLKFFDGRQDHAYCRVPFRGPQCGSRLKGTNIICTLYMIYSVHVSVFWGDILHNTTGP